MNNKKWFVAALLITATMAFAGCGKAAEPAQETAPAETTEAVTEEAAPAETTEAVTEEAPAEEAGAYADGTYFAIGDAFANGWKTTVMLEVKDGKITTVVWNGVSQSAKTDKVTASKNGGYPMVEQGGAKAPWHEQAAAAEQFLIQSQDPKAINYTDDKGHTDAITGVSVTVNDLFALADEALAAGPSTAGVYKDGFYHAQAAEFVNSWKGTVDIAVMNGNIVSASWDGINETDAALTKKVASAEGKYDMKSTTGPWHEQAAKVEAQLIESQDPTAITYTDEEGHVDSISGVTVRVSEFFNLAAEALASAK